MDFLRSGKLGLNDWFYYLIGIFIVILGYGILGQAPLLLVVYLYMDKYDLGLDALKKFEETTDFSVMHISNNLGFFLMVLIFIGAMLALYLALKIQKKKLIDITTARSKFDSGRFFYGFGLWFMLTVIFEIIAYAVDPTNYTFEFHATNFFILLLITVFLLPIQTAFEELFFRGYLNQGLFLLTKIPMVGILVTSLLFSLVHSANPEIDKFGFIPMQFYYVGAGLFLALIAFFDDGLELSIGVHTATNLYGALFIKYSGSVLQTDALWSMKTISVYVMIIAFYISAILFFYFASRKYKWDLNIKRLWEKDNHDSSALPIQINDRII